MKKLSARELEVLIYLTAPCNYDYGEIAEMMNISMNTVKCHIASIHHKLEVSNRVQCLLWLMKNEDELRRKPKPEIVPLKGR